MRITPAKNPATKEGDQTTMRLHPPSWWTRLSPNEKSVIIWLSVAYFVHLVIFGGFALIYSTEIFEQHGPLFQGFSTAVAANLVFFLFVGAAAIYMTLGRPERDNINSRVWYVFRHSTGSRDLNNFLMDQVTNLAAINKNVDITITVTDYLDDDSLKCYDAYCYTRFMILNLLDVPFKDKKHPIKVFTDKIYFPNYDDKVGELSMVRTSKHKEAHVDHLDLGTKAIPLYADYDKTITMEIDSGSTTEFEMKYCVYWKPSGPFFWRCFRYSEDVSVTLRNDLRKKGTLVYGFNKEDCDTELAWHNEHELCKDRTMEPGERLEVFLREPEAAGVAG